MATSQLMRNEAQSINKNWAQIFPNEQVTEQKSCLFVKKLLAVAISNIAYLRAIFPEHAFGDKCLEDLNLKILRDESSCPGACKVIKWVKGCFDALDKKYLKLLVLGIYADANKPESMIESYSFRFSYHSDGEVDIYRNNKKISSAYSADATKSATIRLLRTLVILTNTLTSLPENVMLTMKLYYYDDVTPADYEPPGFKATTDSEILFDKETTKIAIGEVDTPFHSVKVRVKTSKDQFTMEEDGIEEEKQMEKSEDVLTVVDERLHQEDTEFKSQDTDFDVNMFDNKSTSLGQAKPDTKGDTSNNFTKPEINEDEFSVRCPCGCNEDDGLMIMCSKCKFWQHGICFLITDDSKAPLDHICDVCAQHFPNLEPTDPNLSGLTAIAVQGTCLWRRALMACTEFKRIVAPSLAKRLGIETTVAQGLINRLEKEGFISSAVRGKKLGKVVDKDKITKEGIPTYLKTPKSWKKNISCEVEMSYDPDKALSKNSKGKQPEQQVDALIDITNKMDISGRSKRKSATSLQNEKNNQSTQENKGRRGKKRALSKENNIEFEVAHSQEHETARKKKVSTVCKDLVV